MTRIETSDGLLMRIVEERPQDAPTPASHPEYVESFERWKAAGYPGRIAGEHPPGTNPALDFAAFVRACEEIAGGVHAADRRTLVAVPPRSSGGISVAHPPLDAAHRARIARDRAAGVSWWCVALVAPPAEIVAFTLTEAPDERANERSLALDAAVGFSDEPLTVHTVPCDLTAGTAAQRAVLEALPRETPVVPALSTIPTAALPDALRAAFRGGERRARSTDDFVEIGEDCAAPDRPRT
jgi:hypothetical protein